MPLQVRGLIWDRASRHWLTLIALAVLLLYEWIITFDEEVELFWRKKRSVATLLFLLNRYIPLAYALSDFASPTTFEVCACIALFLQLWLI